jgi:hypothetical protein
MASTIWHLQQWSKCRHCGWFHKSIHVGHEISSISQRQSIKQRSWEGESPTKGCLTFKPTLRKSQGAQQRYGKDARNCQILDSHAPHGRWGSVWFSEAQTQHAAWERIQSHRPDRINFTCPRVETRSSQAWIASCSSTSIREECFSNP